MPRSPPLDSLLVEPREFSLDLPVVSPAFEVLSAVTLIFSFSDPQLDFDSTVFPINSKRDHGRTMLLRQRLKATDFFLVKQKTSISQGNMKFVTGLLERADITLVEPALSVVDTSKRLSDMDFPISDRFHLGTPQLDPGLVGLDDRVIASRFPVGDDVFHAASAFPAGMEFRRKAPSPQAMSDPPGPRMRTHKAENASFLSRIRKKRPSFIHNPKMSSESPMKCHIGSS